MLSTAPRSAGRHCRSTACTAPSWRSSSALDFQEQFLIARRDPDFASDLVNLAHAMEPKTKSYLWGIVKIQD